MKTKVCPCCDQPINGIYCKGCRKIVLNPVEQDIKYYLNTRHPDYDHTCTFHGNNASQRSDSGGRTAGRVMTPSESEAKKAEIKARMMQRKRELQSKREARTLDRRGDSKKYTGRDWNGEPLRPIIKANPRNRMLTLIIVTITSLILFLAVMIGIIADANGRMYGIAVAVAEPERAVEAPAMEAAIAVDRTIEVPAATVSADELPVPVETDAAQVESWERTDAEVREAGIACTGYGHFDVTYEDARPILLGCIEDYGLLWGEEEPYSYNLEMDFVSWFRTIYGFVIGSEDEYVGILELETDTATGQIHGITIYTGREECLYELVDIATYFMNSTGIVSEELPEGEIFYREAMKEDGKIQRENGFRMMYDLEVACYLAAEGEDQEFYSMSVYAPGYYTVAE